LPTNLRLYLTFLNGIDQIEVVAATNRRDPPLRPLGVVQGKAQLLELLEKAGITHYVVREGDLLRSTFRSTAVPRTPTLIADALEELFKKDRSLSLKILEGGYLTDEERSFMPPIDLQVYADSVTTEEGIKSLETWFRARRETA